MSDRPAPPTLHDRVLGAWLGLACGDALGATVEFLTAREIKAQYGVHRDITGGGWLRLKPGQVTDDTQMSLYLGRSIIDSGGWDIKAAADALVAWFKTRPPDVGNTCRRGIRRYMVNGSLETPLAEGDGGNGAAMRVLPIALHTLSMPGELGRITLEQCHFTHHHPFSDAASLTLVRMLHALFNGGGVKACRPFATALVAAHPQFRFDPYPGRATAYILDTMQTVLHHFFYTDSLENCIVECVNRGDDADTTGAIAGMLAGALYGAQAVPARWLKKLDPQVLDEIERQAEYFAEATVRQPVFSNSGMSLKRIQIRRFTSVS